MGWMWEARRIGLPADWAGPTLPLPGMARREGGQQQAIDGR